MELLFSSIVATFVIGLSFGAGACMFTCIPTLGVMLLSQDIDAKEVARQTWRFNAGRMSAYSLLASVSGFVGASLVGLLDVAHPPLRTGPAGVFVEVCDGVGVRVGPVVGQDSVGEENGRVVQGVNPDQTVLTVLGPIRALH